MKVFSETQSMDKGFILLVKLRSKRPFIGPEPCQWELPRKRSRTGQTETTGNNGIPYVDSNCMDTHKGSL
jgi:hypothetical protein